MMTRTMAAMMVVSALALVGCGDNGGPSSPTAVTTFPSVSGTYAGTVTIVVPELRETLTCSASTSVTQNGASINIAPILAGGACGGLSIPFGSRTIDQTGAIGGQQSWTSTAACGTYNWTGSGGFFGRELRMTMNATSTTCWNLNVAFTLTR